MVLLCVPLPFIQGKIDARSLFFKKIKANFSLAYKLNIIHILNLNQETRAMILWVAPMEVKPWNKMLNLNSILG